MFFIRNCSEYMVHTNAYFFVHAAKPQSPQEYGAEQIYFISNKK